MATGGETEKEAGTSESANIPEKACKGNKAYVAMVTDQGEEGIARDKPTYKLPDQPEQDLHGKGNFGEGEGKNSVLNTQISESNLVRPTSIAEQSPRLVWELTPNPENEPKFKYVMAPKKDQEIREEDQTN